MYINGRWIESTEHTIEIINPATGEHVQEVAAGGQKETKETIDAAKQAFKMWKNKTGKERGQYLKEIARLMVEKKDVLAEAITKEMGKPFEDAKREILVAADYTEWYGEEAKRVYGDVIPASVPDKHLMVVRQPVGVTAAITPWNFPVSMITRKIAPALAAGCTVIIKPAPSTPLSAIEVFKCFHEAGLPEGVANLIIGPAEEIGPELTSNKDVRKLTFTGSTNVGKHLMRESATNVKKVSMELGGHAPFLVFEDADIDEAVKGALLTKFKNAGQTCISTNRVYVAESIAEVFQRKLTEKVAELKVGNGMEAGVDVGPLVNEQALEKVQDHVADAIKHGGEVLVGGNTFEKEGLSGNFYQPTVIANANESMKIATEETFGPVLPVFTFTNEDDVIERANHDRYGLAAYCYTKDMSRGYHLMNELEYGIIGINDPGPVAAQAPFGGVKESGVGREGGKHGMDEFVEEKFVSMNVKR
ncbi:succinate-semialdehyde dehdyrogenase [Pontibacillus marinus BH030004 = DSM 16465]|uniref:Succinate-semialdehyde dehdyrogenase n=1 Tax=Pontibacillus marinus BH030004 = DSM 16465 TaxID=1385511 RepID=A0A0A5GIC6_9BACI|nr:succinate-semialdehyde dehdyrogenase [Pontibacillus marinus BH030004 = DSM 16465]